MKQAIAIVAALILGGFIGARIASKRRPEPPPFGASSIIEPRPHDAPAPPRNDAESPTVAATTAEPKTGPQEEAKELLTSLIRVADMKNDRQSQQRRMISLLDQLCQSGASAVPAIESFLRKNQDVEIRNGRHDELLPNTLRLALFETLRCIGGPEAVRALGDSIGQTKSVRELIAISPILKQLAPGSYEASAISAARQLLFARPSNRNDRELLYKFLLQNGDVSLKDHALNNLIAENGEPDRGALEYLSAVQDDKAFDFMVAMVTNSSPNRSEEEVRPFVAAISKRVGQNPKADDAFAAFVRDEAIPTDLRFWTIGQLNNISDAEGLNSEQAIDLVKKRMTFIQTLTPSVNDPRLSNELLRMYRDLEQMLAKDPDAR